MTTGASTIVYQPGDVVLLPSPYTDLSAAKTRPVVVVGSELYLENYSDLLVCYASSQLSSAVKPLDYVLRHWQKAGLLRPSFMRPKLATVSHSLVVLKIGVISDDDKAGLARMLGKAIFSWVQ
jgi:mRNA interferase MazF